MNDIAIGGNVKLIKSRFILNHTMASSTDVSVFFLNDTQKVEGDEGMIFYGTPISPCGSVKLSASNIEFDLDKVPSHIIKLAVTATVDTASFSDHSNIILSSDEFKCSLDTTSRTETALILMELYKHSGNWKVRFVAQGFNGGLKPLAEHFGVEIADDSSSEQRPNIPIPLVAPKSMVNLVKGSVSLKKGDKPVTIEKTPLLTATVSWQSGTDYDIYALIMLRSGEQVTVATFGAQGVPALQNYGNNKVSHRGDIVGSGDSGLSGLFKSKPQLSTEIIDIRLSDDIVAVVPVAYSAQSNGSGSFYRYKVSLAINNGSGTSVEITADKANNNDKVYTCVPGIIYNRKEGVEIGYLEQYSSTNSENRPKLSLNADGSVCVTMDAGPKNDYK
jgi:tellurite resistance protein TerA